jgi:CCR4-NOT transcription complex subunit 1
VFKGSLQELGVQLDERSVAEIIVAVMYPYRPKAADGSDLENKDGKNFNLDVVVDVLSRECRGMRWPNVCRALDLPNLIVVNDGHFQTLVKLFVAISGRPLPAIGLMGLWSNRTAQLALLHYSWNAPRTQVDFSDMYNNSIVFEGAMGEDVNSLIPSPPNSSWRCLLLYRTLLDIAVAGLAVQVLELFLQAVRLYPEYITIGLAMTADHSNPVSTEVLRRSLPLFTGLQASSRPSSGHVMAKLAEVNQGLLLVLFRMAFKNVSSCQDVLNLDTRLKSMGTNFIAKLQEGATLDEILSYWCVLAEQADLSRLEAKLQDLLSKNPQLAVSVYNFAKTHAANSRSIVVPPNERGVLSLEALSTLGNVLKFYPQFVPPQELADLMSLRRHHSDSLGSAIPEASSGVRAPLGTGDNSVDQGAGVPGSSEFEEVEDLANSYFQKIYTADISIPDVIQLLKRFKSSSDPREQELFRCMIHNLFDEYRFFHKYPEMELEVTGRLFGTLIQHQLVSSITLGIALRYVLEALRKDPEQGGSMEKMFRFGRISLEQFRSRLIEWPQYCSHLVQIPHLATYCPELFKEAQRSISNPAGAPGPTATDSMAEAPTAGRPPLAPAAVAATQQQLASMSLATSSAGPAPTAEDANGGMGVSSMQPIIDKMVEVNQDIVSHVQPPETVRDQIYFIINNIAKANLVSKTNELKGMLDAGSYYNWFANYMVVKRISSQPNLHPIYLNIVDILDSPALVKAMVNSAYFNATKLLVSTKITTSSSERSLLRNLGVWLGQITLARNKPILQRRCDLKGLLIWGYESGRLIAVCSFIAKVLEGCKDSKIFRPPNPWLVSVLGLLRELYEIDDLKMNIKFEIQVLCKNIDVRIEDVPKTSIVAQLPLPSKERSPDFNVKGVAGGVRPPPSPPLMAQQPPQVSPLLQPITAGLVQNQPQYGVPIQSQPVQPAAEVPVEDQKLQGLDLNIPQEQTVIPNLSSYINISTSLQFFVKNPAMRKVVALAVDRAIREIIQPVVERSVTISCVTTKQLVLKDFALEPNEQQLRTAAHLMVSNLAGSMALVTSKEPLRVSIGNHIRTFLSSTITDQATLEQLVQVCSNDNVDLGCMLIEKAATEKAIRDIDEGLAVAIQMRRKHRETGQPFVDPSLQQKGGRYPRELPEILKPKVGGLAPAQLMVYEGFHRQPRSSALLPSTGAVSAKAPGSLLSAQQAPVAATLTMTQGLEAYQQALSRLDNSLKSALQQTPGATLATLGGDHEILDLLRDVIQITQRVQQRARIESATAFAESVFKRLVELSSPPSEILQYEVLVGILEALRDACGGSKALPLDIVAWLNRYSTYNLADESQRDIQRTVLSLLMRAGLLLAADVDVYFANNLDGGMNMLWVEVALNFVKHCITEDLAATYEFTTIFDTVGKIRPANVGVRKQLQKWLTDLRALATAKDEQKAAAAASAAPAASTAAAGAATATTTPAATAALVGGKEQVVQLLERWMRVWTTNNDQVFGQYLQLMHQFGVLKTEEAADRFFRLATEVCADACSKSSQPTPSTELTTAPPLLYNVIDALAKLFLQLIRLADRENATVRMNLFSRIVQAVARALIDDVEAKNASGGNFDQRPYYRLFVNLFQDLGVCDPKQDPSPAVPLLLSVFTQILLALQPSQVPAFSFAWLQLISHRSFLPHFLHSKNPKGWAYLHRLLIAQLLFLQPFLKSAQLSEPIRRLYKGTLRMMLVLLHDFPEFLCDYHVSLCDVIPSSCVQLRNLVLSAFPRTMRLPDPFTPNLKVDLLPEISQSPRILTEYVTILTERNIKPRIDAYLSNRQPADLPAQLATMMSAACKTMETQPFISAIVVYVGVQANVIQQQTKAVSLQNSSALEFFKQILVALDTEGRYCLLNAMANQLRYPNNQTHAFSCMLLLLFAETDQEVIQEQITRVLLERLIVHRPHPASS